MKLYIEPNDVLMFRDGRPFAGGDDHFARGVFPPSPGTIYGALRSHILSHHWPEYNKFASVHEEMPEKLQKEIGTPNGLGSLTLCQLTLAKRNGDSVEQYFPIPRDIAKGKGCDDGKLYLLSPKEMSGITTITDLPASLNNMWYLSEKTMEAVSGFVSSKEMGEYLLGKSPLSWIKSDELFKTEERTGIQKSRKTRSVETGRLYSVEYFRMAENTGFAVEVSNTELLSKSGILRLGGDNRSAHYMETSWNEIAKGQIKKKVSEGRRFKLVLITPAIFENGWLPEGMNKGTMQGEINGIAVKMIAACIGKPVGIGGYDLVKNRPKTMKKAVPAGSVYYFELQESSIDDLFERVWHKSISDEKSQEGFGITLIGGFDYV